VGRKLIAKRPKLIAHRALQHHRQHRADSGRESGSGRVLECAL